MVNNVINLYGVLYDIKMVHNFISPLFASFILFLNKFYYINKQL